MAYEFMVLAKIDPVIFSIGPLSIRWYGMMYLLGFAAAMLLANYRAQKPGSVWTKEQVGDLLFYGFLGVILGGRIGYVLFYHFDLFLDNPLYLFRIWEGGMSFHGGLLGVIAAMFWRARKEQKTFWQVADFVAPLIPIGLGLGRLGNFINSELWGRQSDVAWAIIFPDPASGGVPRHPSQLYQFALEGVVLFTLLWWFSSKTRKPGAVAGLFLLGYGSFRFLVEYVREPDAHLGVLMNMITMGQLLSLPMIIYGAYLMLRAAPAAAKS
ncbi:prolipoprotein diacylglyceryl transferase [Corallincola luteus]|uniref:Phosphatidylglycerol--prolipoprotein diacylglyceryl transferase n=1 Tax=Corallincola luteus TaxID=1775177 RepID=A0ABY2AIN6_9GAMM|nr:prolipoprotein diacylglyceryl transferase [Corallincola luteus]TCI02148.1 prolipoprotein diacylglyceryl transferase [Corallincola luteus]